MSKPIKNWKPWENSALPPLPDASEEGLDWMFHERTCPKMDVLLAGGEKVLEHIKECPFCSEALKNLWLYKSMADKIDDKIIDVLKETFASDAEEAPISVGDIRMVIPTMDKSERWDEEGMYFNPPEVLVLTKPENGKVKVAQTFVEHDLRGYGNFPIQGRGYNSRYAESWNTYDVPISMLSKHRFKHRVEKWKIEEIIEASKKETPDGWLDETDEVFRDLEKRVAEFFVPKS